jgi:hypothetical protein
LGLVWKIFRRCQTNLAGLRLSKETTRLKVRICVDRDSTTNAKELSKQMQVEHGSIIYAVSDNRVGRTSPCGSPVHGKAANATGANVT